MSASTRNLIISHSYALDMANFLNVLTDDPFYTTRHSQAHAIWAPRLSPESREAIASAVSLQGSAMLGPYLSYLIAAVPGFEQMELAALLTLPRQRFEGLAGFWEQDWNRFHSLALTVLPVVAELDRLGFRSWWESERLPLIDRAAVSIGDYLATLDLDLGQAAAAMLGTGAAGAARQIQLFLCTFAAPHGMKIHGWRYASDVTFDPAVTVRIAIHEMFHPPYRLEEIRAEADRLIADPLFQESFRNKDPKYGYSTEDGFLEENVVEAMEVYVSSRAGLLDDPLGYLSEHDDGSHKLSVVLLRYFRAVEKAADEPFTTYFRRLVGQMPVGRLQAVYDEEMTRG